MNYQHILSKAWEITWNNKYLWVFGFFAGIALGESNNNSSSRIIQGGAWLFQNLGNIFSSQTQTALILFIISIAVWILGTFARIGLIFEVDKLNTKYSKPISSILGVFRAAKPKFLPIVAMQLLIWSPVIIFGLIYSVLAQAFFMNAFSGSMQSLSAGFFGSFGLLWLMGCSTGILSIILYFVDAFAYRSLVLDDAGVKGSIGNSLNLLKDNAGQILLLALICGFIGIIFMFALTLLLSPLFLLMLRPMMDFATQCMSSGGNFNALTQCIQQTNSNPTVVLISLGSSIIMAALTSIWVTFQSATFTIAFNKLKS